MRNTSEVDIIDREQQRVRKKGKRTMEREEKLILFGTTHSTRKTDRGERDVRRSGEDESGGPGG